MYVQYLFKTAPADDAKHRIKLKDILTFVEVYEVHTGITTLTLMEGTLDI